MTGRRGPVALLLAAVISMALAGCADQLPGVDGDLVDDWPAAAVPVAHQQKAGVCQTLKTMVEEDSSRDAYVVDCATEHYGETAFAGELTEADAQLAEPPTAEGLGSAGIAVQVKTYRECDKQASAYLGRRWHHRFVKLVVVYPSRAAWHGGARWFRCDMFELTWTGRPLNRHASLRTSAPAAVCWDLKIGKPLECGTRHNGEYVGSYVSSAAKPPSSAADYKPVHQECYRLIAAYLGVSRSQVPYLTGVGGFAADSDQDWARGYRKVDCFLWLGDKFVTGSARGRSGKGL